MKKRVSAWLCLLLIVALPPGALAEGGSAGAEVLSGAVEQTVSEADEAPLPGEVYDDAIQGTSASAGRVLELPDDLEVVEKAAFCGTTSVEKVVLSRNTSRIRAKAFADSALTEIVIPNAAVEIAADAFDRCAEDLVIKGRRGSTAEAYAAAHGIRFAVLDATELPGEDYFAEAAADRDRLISEARAQYMAGDHTHLDAPVRYNVLWLGFTHATFGELDFQMTAFDRDYLQAVTANFEGFLESVTHHDLDITVTLHFIDSPVPLTEDTDEGWLYLAQETVQTVIDRYTSKQAFDTVLTTVQSAGAKNRARNESKADYGVHTVITGLETADMSSPLGYSTFDLDEPDPDKYPLADPAVPSFYTTAVAVHEWMHQLEYMGTLLGIEYPPTHASAGPPEFPGYQKYTADLNDYDFFEFYRLVLQGKLPYTGGGATKHVGMYPKMWRLVKRDVFDLGTFAIRSADGLGYLAANQDDPMLTLSDERCLWRIRYGGDERFILSPKAMPHLRIDLENAWDEEGNGVGLCVDTGYADAQSWYLTMNPDGSYCIRTVYESGRAITVPEAGQSAILCSVGADGEQKWIIESAS